MLLSHSEQPIVFHRNRRGIYLDGFENCCIHTNPSHTTSVTILDLNEGFEKIFKIICTFGFLVLALIKNIKKTIFFA